MAEVTINSVKEAFILFDEKITAKVALLEQRDQIKCERLVTLENDVLRDPRGKYGLMYNGDQYSRDEKHKGNVAYLKRDLLIGVVTKIRFIDSPHTSPEKYPMMPSDYVDLAIDAITGTEVYNNRPEYERKIIPLRTEIVDEKDGVWTYLTVFSIPRDFVEEQFRS